MKTVLKGVALGLMAVPLLAGVALAGGPEHVEGNCGNQAELVEGGNIRTVEGVNIQRVREDRVRDRAV